MNGVGLALDASAAAPAAAPADRGAALLLGRDWRARRGLSSARASAPAWCPVLNALASAGIVSLPGMMTGQILAGADPSQAVMYQILIMFLIAAGSRFRCHGRGAAGRPPSLRRAAAPAPGSSRAAGNERGLQRAAKALQPRPSAVPARVCDTGRVMDRPPEGDAMSERELDRRTFLKQTGMLAALGLGAAALAGCGGSESACEDLSGLSDGRQANPRDLWLPRPDADRGQALRQLQFLAGPARWPALRWLHRRQGSHRAGRLLQYLGRASARGSRRARSGAHAGPGGPGTGRRGRALQRIPRLAPSPGRRAGRAVARRRSSPPHWPTSSCRRA